MAEKTSEYAASMLKRFDTWLLVPGLIRGRIVHIFPSQWICSYVMLTIGFHNSYVTCQIADCSYVAHEVLELGFEEEGCAEG